MLVELDYSEMGGGGGGQSSTLGMFVLTSKVFYNFLDGEGCLNSA
jgi:hypothetical protein